MEENKVENVINIIKDMDIKDKLRLGICLSNSSWTNILYDKTEMYEKFDTMLKEIDEEYRTTLINFAKYKLVMYTMAKIMEMKQTERNKIVLYLFNNVNQKIYYYYRKVAVIYPENKKHEQLKEKTEFLNLFKIPFFQ